jgi:hypothetical protein
MGARRHIQSPTGNWQLRSVSRRCYVGSPKHHRRLPVTLLPTALVSESSEIRVWIYIQGDQNVSVRLVVTVRKTRKNILQQFQSLTVIS